MSPLLCLLLLLFSVAGGDPRSSCGGDRCGDLVLPFPFHLNSSSSSCISSSNSSSLFLMSCVNATYLTLSLGGAAFRVIDFSPSGPGNSLLLDYAPDTPVATPCDPAYAALNSRPSSSSPAAALDAAAGFLAVSPANVLRLYACDDSSLCRAAACAADACGGKTKTGCCYPLSESDGGVWKHGDGLSVFAAFGCRGFSSWVTTSSSSSSSSAPAVTRRGIEVEWAVPRGSPLAACAGGAAQVNSTGVRGGVRCACVAPGLAGDGFALGTGCTKAAAATCGNGEAGDSSCCEGRFCSKKAVALAGFFVSVFFLAAAVSFWLFLRQPATSSSYSRRWDLDPACIPKILAGVSDARQFTHEQLDAATRRFDEAAEKGSCSNFQAMDGANGVRGGVLESGAVVAVQRVGCETPEKLRIILDAMEVSHRNVARVVGFCCCVESSGNGGGTLLLVHESSGNGGTLEEHLRRRAAAKPELGWYNRVSIAVELAGALAHLQHAHGIFLHDLRSSDVFFPGAGADQTAKIAGHKLLSSSTADYSYYYGADAAAAREQDVVRNFGGLLIELLTGIRHQQPLDTVAPKVREGRLHEVLDPALLLSSSASASGKKQNLNQMLPASGEEVRKVLEIAVRCVEIENNGGMMGMGMVARELVEVVRDSMGSSSKIEISLEETFSSSSLLQMISMSPETMHRHLPC